VQTLALTSFPLIARWVMWRLGRNRRFVCTLEWLTLFPVIGPFPQISQRWDMCLSMGRDVHLRRARSGVLEFGRSHGGGARRPPETTGGRSPRIPQAPNRAYGDT
jgi:hypothetical protein